MKRLLSSVILLCCLFVLSHSLKAQTLTFSASFVYGSSNNCPQWTAFQTAITPGIYTGIRMYGSLDPVGITCNDPVIANAMALNIKNSTAYASPSTGGHVWSVCNRYQAEVWIDPPALCSGSNCPNPGYLMRPCFGTTNFGGVNSATCSTIPTQTMSIDLIAPPPCAQPTGVVATSITTTGAQLSWAPVSGSAGYEYVIDQNSASPSGSGTPTGSTSVPIGGLNINSSYYFHVRNKCTSVLYSLWTNYSFMTADAYCKPPLNIFFSNITTNSVDILWSKMPTADYYQYKIDLTPAVPNAGNYLTTTGISAHIGSLLPDTKYYVQVRSICLNGSDSSTWKLDSFVTKNYCGMPELHVATPGNNPVIWWYRIDNAVAYEYRLSNYNVPPAFGDEVHDTTVALTLPNDNSDQFLHVRTKCNSQFAFSQWATIALRTSNPNAVKDVKNMERAVMIYPNPVKDKFTVLSKDAISGSYTVTDVAGKVLLKGHMVKDAEIDLSKFANGTYIFKYILNSKTGIIKLVKE